MPTRYFTGLILSLAATAGAQARIPIRTIGPILATSTESVGESPSIRGISDGHVIVGAITRQRVYMFDSTLKSFTLIVDSATGTGSFRTFGLIPYFGDSTLLPDIGASALLVLDASGKQVRSIAPPSLRDLVRLGSPFGQPGLDQQGRLIYRTNALIDTRPTPGQKVQWKSLNPDSIAIVRGDFETRRVDTVAWVRTPSQGRVGIESKENLSGGPPSLIMHMLGNPFSMADEWSLLSDGTVAIVRAHDYHVDWVDPDGTSRSSPKMPFDWRRYTDAEKRARADSVKKNVEEGQKRNTAAQTNPGAPKMSYEFNIVPDSEFPEFWPPIEPGSVRADLDGHLWILPTTSANAGNGLTYDVVNRKGEIIERVQLPKDHVLAGFGPHDIVYLTKVDGKNTYLVRALLTRPSK